jgi:DNA-binding transcriptional LysR family regulator
MAADWWSGIEMRHLVALDAVAREGSFRRAATRLGYVQSAISHQIAALEGMIGKRLIERSRGTRPLALTPAGEILLAHADALIARVRAAQADLAALDESAGSTALRVGATPDLLARLVPALLRAYGAPVSLHETPTRRALLAALVRGELDLALAETPLPRGPLDALPLCADHFVVIVQKSALLAQRGRAVSTDELARLPLIAHAPTREHVEEQLRAQGIEARFVLEAETGVAVQGLVAAGLGAAVVPKLVADERRVETSVLQLPDGLVGPRAIAAVWCRTQPLCPDASAFVEAARAACAGERLREPRIVQLAG